MNLLGKDGVSITGCFMTTLRHVHFYLGRGWLAVWVLVVPLIHIHPEIDHAHGAQGHVHSGQYHSVLSEDLSCEFHRHSHSSPSPSSGNAVESVKSVHLFGHVFNHPEIGFSLNKSGDDPLVLPGPGSFLAISDRPSIKIIRLLAETYPSQGSPPNWLFVSQHRVRPPPLRPS